MSTENPPIETARIDPTPNRPTIQPPKPLRLWPGVVAAALLILFRYVIPFIVPDAEPFGVPITLIGMLVAAISILAIVVWWIFFSRAAWSERLGAVALIAVAIFITTRIIHPSIAGGAMGYLFYVLALPVLCVALVAWAVVSGRLSVGPKRAALVGFILVVCGAFAVIRTGGITSNFDNDFHWRWSKTPEERLLAQQAIDQLASAPSVPSVATGTNWPGFRGSQRDGIVRGLSIKTDWAASPPVEMWRRPIGPAWSSFAVQGDRLYTQEQRGNDEVVACYQVSTGKPVWIHRDAARFYESNAGPGPRGTPTLHHGRVYTLGATGILNALNADDGAVVWSRNAASDTKAKLPGWGFASSPLVIGDVVVVATSGTLAGYEVATGKPLGSAPPVEVVTAHRIK